MSKYKLCPDCGARNNPQEMECLQCGADFQGVPILDEESERKVTEAPFQGKEEKPSAVVRVCECGVANPVRNRKCSECGQDISYVPPTPSRVERSAGPEITFIGMEESRVLDKGLSLLGREGSFAGLLASKPFVSRRHAEISFDGSTLAVRDLGSTNGTFVNGERISEGEVRLLSDGDEVGLGGRILEGVRQDNAAYFVVRIKACL